MYERNIKHCVCMCHLSMTHAASVAAAREFNLFAAGSHTPDLKVSQIPACVCVYIYMYETMHYCTQCADLRS